MTTFVQNTMQTLNFYWRKEKWETHKWWLRLSNVKLHGFLEYLPHWSKVCDYENWEWTNEIVSNKQLFRERFLNCTSEMSCLSLQILQHFSINYSTYTTCIEKLRNSYRKVCLFSKYRRAFSLILNLKTHRHTKNTCQI